MSQKLVVLSSGPGDANGRIVGAGVLAAPHALSINASTDNTNRGGKRRSIHYSNWLYPRDYTMRQGDACPPRHLLFLAFSRLKAVSCVNWADPWETPNLKLLKPILLAGLMLVLGFGIVLAQDDITSSLKQAVDFLSKKLGRPIPSIDTYTYEVVTFADASLDCPEPGKVYSPGAVPGYKFLITVGGISYDVRISTDGSLATLCNNTAIKQTSTLATYRNPQFSIPYPDTWRVTVRDSDIIFGLSQSLVCSQPGMIVTQMGTVPTTKTPDNILDDYAQNPNAVGAKFDTDRISLGGIGRSVLYVAPCADGSPRQSRISAFVAYGRAYR